MLAVRSMEQAAWLDLGERLQSIDPDFYRSVMDELRHVVESGERLEVVHEEFASVLRRRVGLSAS